VTAPTVFVVDDDAAVRDGLALLLDTAGLAVETFDSADAFLAAFDVERPGCLVVDVRMPGKTGPELQGEMTRRGLRLPVIFLTAYGDVPTTVQAMKAGAVDFLTKPIDAPVLLECVKQAIESDARQRAAAEVANGRRGQ
jgi:FixJ family two-component response regulator